MYARSASYIVKPGLIQNCCRIVDDIARNLVAKQPGFIDHIILVSEAEPRLTTVMSLWQSREDAESFLRDWYPAIFLRLASLVDGRPEVEYFTCVSTRLGNNKLCENLSDKNNRSALDKTG
jgi:hypothetical protein